MDSHRGIRFGDIGNLRPILSSYVLRDPCPASDWVSVSIPTGYMIHRIYAPMASDKMPSLWRGPFDDFRALLSWGAYDAYAFDDLVDNSRFGFGLRRCRLMGW